MSDKKPQRRATVEKKSGSTNETRTFSHTGAEIGEDNVELYENTTDSVNPILKWEVPKKYRKVVYAGGKHPTKAVLRTREDFPTHEGEEIEIEGRLQPTAGETKLDDQPFPAVVVANTSTDEEIEIEDIDYATGTVTLAEDPDGDDVAAFPTISDGVIKYVAENQFDQQVGPLDKFGVPVHVFNDFRQGRNQTEIHLVGSARFRRDEKIVVTLDSPHEIVWEDEDYPRGKFASRLEQKVDVSV